MQNLGSLSTQYPILLFPVRVQVKFLTTSSGGHELRVRFYPDQIGIDTHQPGLSQQEIAAGQQYWQQEGEPTPRTTLHSLGSWRRLVAAYGSARASWVVEQTTPSNLAAIVTGLTTGTVPAPAFAEVPPAGTSGQHGPHTQLMPDYFTVTLYQQQTSATAITDPVVKSHLLNNLDTAYSVESFPEPTTEFLYPVRTEQAAAIVRPLPVGLSLTETSTSSTDNSITDLDDRMAWMVDYEQAVQAGLAVTILLTPEEYAQGFKRLVVVGVRTEGDATTQAVVIQDMLQAHTHTDGLALVAQGTPTNNTDSQESGYGSNEEFNAEATFPLLTQPAAYAGGATAAAAEQMDGQRLSTALGLEAATFTSVAGALATDAREAIDINNVLWPATYGYFLEEMMRPMFSTEAIDWVRSYFAPNVLGRGPLPAFRVGNVPYGVLPTTRFSAWTPATSLGAYGQQLTRTLRRLDMTWTERLNKAGRYPQNGTAGVPLPAQPSPYQNLLTVLAADATSSEFYQRYMLGPDLTDTLDALAKSRNRTIWPAITAGGTSSRRTQGRFGVDGAPANPLYEEFLRWMDTDAELELREAGQPRIFDQTFQRGYTKLLHTFADEMAATTDLGVTVDEDPLSETEPLSPLAGTDVNFIQWLASPTTSFDDIRREDFSALYEGNLSAGLTAPRSLLYLLLRQAVLQLYWDAAARTQELTTKERAEPEFFNVLSAQTARWQILYDRPAFAGGQVLHRYLRSGGGAEGQRLVAYFQQLNRLSLLPTARLERLLAEHLDLGNHRLDAWQVSQVSYRLNELRQVNPTGVFCGAYGWLEDVRASDRSVAGSDGVREDPDNLGYIHAPTPNQAATAAILRQGYKSRQFAPDPQDPAGNRLAINLSSARVREALHMLEGIRGGASLAALLGQHFEQGLTQTAGQVSGQSYAFFIRYFRSRFPQAAAISPANESQLVRDVAPEQAARQVVDGLALLRTAMTVPYPYGISELPADAGLAAVVKRQMTALQDTVDALGDVAVSEGVFQATQGNAERAGAVLESIAKGKFPVLPDVVQPPRAGKALTHRVLLHLPAMDSPALDSWGSIRTPRALAEPGVNRWLATFFGDPSQILFEYELVNTVSTNGNATLESISLAALQLQPIDLLLLLDDAALRSGSVLDSLLVQAIQQEQVADNFSAPVTAVAIQYTTAGAQALRRLLPLAGRLRQLLGGSRSARPEDFILPTAATVVADSGTYMEAEVRARLTQVKTLMENWLETLVAATEEQVATPASYAAQVRQMRTLLRQAVLLGIPAAAAAIRATDGQLPGALAATRAVILERLSAYERTVSGTEELGRRLTEAAQELLGREFRLALPVTLTGTGADLFQSAAERQAALLTGAQAPAALLQDVPLLLQEWLQGVARVREPLDHLDKVSMLHELIQGEADSYAPIQLQPLQLSAQPAPTQEWWLGMGYPTDYNPAGDVVSIVQLQPTGYDPTASQYALWLDEWTETLPDPKVATALAFHYDQPNTEPPQTLLLAVAPQAGAGTAWSFEDLLGTVNETLDLAKKRTVEPDSLAFTHLSTLLPALVAPVTQQEATFSLDFRQLTGNAQYPASPLLPDN